MPFVNEAHGEISDQLHHYVVWDLHCLQLYDLTAHCEHSWEDHWRFSPLPPEHLQHPPRPQSNKRRPSGRRYQMPDASEHALPDCVTALSIRLSGTLSTLLPKSHDCNLHVPPLAHSLTPAIRPCWQIKTKRIGFIYRNKSNFLLICSKTTVESAIFSPINYGDAIHRNATASTLRLLDLVYYSTVRFITSDGYSSHRYILYDKVGWPSLTARCNNHWYLYIISPDWKMNIIHHITIALELWARVPRARTELGKTTFSVNAANSGILLQCDLKVNTPIPLGRFSFDD